MESSRADTRRYLFAGDQLAGAIYGTVTAMAVITALADKSNSIYLIAGGAVLTPLVLAVTYMYAHWIADSHGMGAHSGASRHWAEEIPTLVVPVLLAAELLLAYSVDRSVVVAAESAMWFGVVILFFLGFRAAQQSGHTTVRAVIYGLLDSMIGAALVLIKVLVH